MAHTSEYEIEDIFIDRLEGIGYKFIKLNNYDEVLANFREQLAKFNAKKLEEKGHTASFSDSEFNRIMIHVDNHSVYESAKVLRDKYDLQLDNGESVYIEFFSGDTDRNIYQVTHQVTMDKAHKDDVVYKNRYDVTVLINGLPLVQIELKRPGVEINEAINQINRYRKFSFKGIFRYLQLFVVSNSVQTKYFCNENEMLDGQYNPILKSLVFFWTDEKNTRINDLNTFTGEFFRKSAITEMLNKYMVIKTTEPVLMVMRPYQIYAVKAAKKRVLEVNQNGYVFACTGSGKTLTSFKLAQILRDEPMVDLVVFLIDRKDLDDQTIDEYNSFEKDCVDRTNSTAVLINMLKSSEKKMIVTTIQKMANAVKNPKYAAVMDAYKDKKVVFIIDECHRSQFGKMHSLIQKHFERANYIGFTGTPIFERNKGVDGRTTADVFYAGDKLDACLHKYMIKDAIADGNVLRFSVEYQSVVSAEEISINGIDPKQLDDPEYCRRHNIDIESLYHNDERISKIAKHIFEHHEQHAHPQGKDIYTALFAVDKIQTLGKYYDEFKKLNDVVPEDKKLKIAAVFSYQTNEDMDDGADEHSQELLERCMKDYKDLFGVEFTFGTFDAYRKDITRRLKQQDSPQIDILLVVNMFLTGFDAKPLNTLYLDKNLIWHSLVQAYSRTEMYMAEILENDGVTYEEAFADDDYRSVVEEWSLTKLGYVIRPENLFRNLIRKITKFESEADRFSVEDFEKAINDLVGSTMGHESNKAFDGLFNDMRLKDARLGESVADRTDMIGRVMVKVSDIDFDLQDSQFDVLGTAYMILIGLFASDAGKKGGEFFTPAGPSRLCATLASLGLDEAKTVGDCTCGSASMLLEVQKHLTTHKVGHFYGQELNATTYNLSRMNMIMHGVDWQNFDIYKGDTLKDDKYGYDLRLTVQVCNPPYSLKWSADKKFEDDPRYRGVGKLAPKSAADLAFVEHMIYHMDETDGRVAVLLPHGVLFRGGAEEAIRKYIIKDLNRLDAVIGLPANLFHGTGIPVCVLVLKSNRNGNSGNILFIDASKEFKPGKNQNILEQEHIDKIVDAYEKRAEIDKFAHKAYMSEIIENGYNLNIPRYVDTFEEEEPVDLDAVRNRIKTLDSETKAAIDKAESFMRELGL